MTLWPDTSCVHTDLASSDVLLNTAIWSRTAHMEMDFNTFTFKCGMNLKIMMEVALKRCGKKMKIMRL